MSATDAPPALEARQDPGGWLVLSDPDVQGGWIAADATIDVVEVA